MKKGLLPNHATTYYVVEKTSYLRIVQYIRRSDNWPYTVEAVLSSGYGYNVGVTILELN